MLHSSEAEVQGDNAGISKVVNPSPWLDSSSSEGENTQKAVPETASEIRNDFDDETSVSGEQAQNLDAETLDEHMFVEYTCLFCDERFGNKKLVETHVRAKHKNISKRNAQKDVQETASEIRNDFDDETSVSGEQAQHLDAETLNEHIFVEYICFVCEERFENKNLVETHVRTKHKNISKRDSHKETPKHSERGKSIFFYELANWFLILSTLMQLVELC